MDQWFVLDINPEPWAIGPVGYRRSGGKMSAYVGQNKQLDAYKQAVREAILDLDPIMEQGKVDITFFFWRNRAEYSTPQARTHRKHDADATNLQKATEDALQGILYENDKDNTHVESWMMEQGPGVTPRIVIHCQDALLLPTGKIPPSVWAQILGGTPTAPPPSDNVWRGPEDNQIGGWHDN